MAIKTENVVAPASLVEELDLRSIPFDLDGTGCEPEQFPDHVYRIDESKVVVLLFGSGKLVCTGARKFQGVETAVGKMTEELRAAGLLC
jgi:transcription initiation factor TFIID TATA-box-binding protein